MIKAMGAALVAVVALAVPAAAQEMPGFEMSFVDGTTGAPVENVCLGMVDESDRGVVEPQLMVQCSDSSGKVRNYYTNRHRFYVWSKDGSYGSHWVGPHGPTGVFARAKWFEAKDRVTRVTVTMGAPGEIAGIVTDSTTGAPVAGLCPMPTPAGKGFGGFPGVTCSNDAGEYKISGLAAADWVVQFADFTGKYAWEWSGNAPNRLAASTVRVRSGATTALGAKLQPAGQITGKLVNVPDRGQYTSIDVVNRWTGDFASPRPVKDSTTLTYSVTGLNTQLVEISYVAMGTPRYEYPEPVRVTAGRTTPDIDLVFPPQS
ncbi:hypothetical protein [Kibdelosporangium aridum]|nr:hypothetical protein [Kibdelosporangium aridum]